MPAIAGSNPRYSADDAGEFPLDELAGLLAELGEGIMNRSQRMQIAQQLLELLPCKAASRGRHQIASVQNHLRHAVIARRGPARKIWLAKDAVETRTVQRLSVISIVTARTRGNEDCPSARLLRRQR